MDFILAYITAKDKEQALSIGRALVEGRLAACVNVVDGMSSVYRWGGEVCVDSEAILIAKTSTEKFEALTACVKEMHTYECPCIVSIPIISGNPAYLTWLGEQVG
jgi:periplasmic divalent cation tolerance protein